MAARKATGSQSRTLWRISNYSDLSGEGGLRYSARWHTAGHPIVYLAETPAGALLEILVHLEIDEARLPRRYQLLRIHVPNDVTVETIAVPRGNRWKDRPAITQALGDAWLDSARTALARVPSAILPSTPNYLLNPTHPAASRIRVLERQLAHFDVRLLRKR